MVSKLGQRNQQRNRKIQRRIKQLREQALYYESVMFETQKAEWSNKEQKEHIMLLLDRLIINLINAANIQEAYLYSLKGDKLNDRYKPIKSSRIFQRDL